MADTLTTNKNLTFTSSVISHNLFEHINNNLKEGSIETHAKISELAIKFETLFGGVSNWETFLSIVNEKRIEEKPFWDWEEFLLEFVVRELDIKNPFVIKQ